MAALKKKKIIKKRKVIAPKAKKPTSAKKVKKVTQQKKFQKVRKAKKNRKPVKKVVKKSSKKKGAPDLKRSKKNPIIEPSEESYWESKATFNPTAFEHDGKVHIIYRAIGDTDISVLGYAKSDDGHSIVPGSKELAYYHRNRRPATKTGPKINYASGGGWSGGCEDPRLTLLGDRVNMIYTSFDGWGSIRMALTSITLDDFISRRWNWDEPVFISPPEQIHKNWVLFPEKIKGKFAILHSISPKIMVDYFDSLNELDGDTYIYSVHQGSSLWESRDKFIRGIGPTPLKTKYGWLVFYHKMEKHETHRYKLWAMILDLKNPTKILYKGENPVLEPDVWYENEGFKEGVVYSCGAIIRKGELFVYYGGADKVSCVATANLDKFLDEIVHKRVPILKKRRTKLKA